MTALPALARAQAAGLNLAVAGDRLRWRGPQPSPELLAELRAHKAKLVALLAENKCRPLAPALVAACERAAAAVAPGPADDMDEAEAIRALAAQPAPRSAEGHREHVEALARAGLLRPPSWGDPAAVPSPGSRCSCCHGSTWWTERADPSGWRCCTCHPPDHLLTEQLREMRT